MVNCPLCIGEKNYHCYFLFSSFKRTRYLAREKSFWRKPKSLLEGRQDVYVIVQKAIYLHFYKLVKFIVNKLGCFSKLFIEPSIETSIFPKIRMLLKFHNLNIALRSISHEELNFYTSQLKIKNLGTSMLILKVTLE